MQTKDQTLRDIFAKVKKIDQLNARITRLLPPDLAKNCHIGNVEQGRLIIIAANGAVATQIRYLTADLLRLFQADPLLRYIKKIDCKVRAPMRPSSRLSARLDRGAMPPLSTETAEIVHDIAQSITDEKVKKALEKIAKNTKEKE